MQDQARPGRIEPLGIIHPVALIKLDAAGLLKVSLNAGQEGASCGTSISSRAPRAMPCRHQYGLGTARSDSLCWTLTTGVTSPGATLTP